MVGNQDIYDRHFLRIAARLSILFTVHLSRYLRCTFSTTRLEFSLLIGDDQKCKRTGTNVERVDSVLAWAF